MNRKTIALIVLNLAAAAAVGLIVGLFYKYVLSDEETSAPQEENAVYIESVRSQESGPEPLRDSIASVIAGEDAVVGVAAVFSDGDTLVLVDSSGYTGDLHASMKAVSGLDDAFPMMSVPSGPCRMRMASGERSLIGCGSQGDAGHACGGYMEPDAG